MSGFCVCFLSKLVKREEKRSEPTEPMIIKSAFVWQFWKCLLAKEMDGVSSCWWKWLSKLPIFGKGEVCKMEKETLLYSHKVMNELSLLIATGKCWQLNQNKEERA